MSCRSCDETKGLFRRKLGRCRQCIIQLLIIGSVSNVSFLFVSGTVTTSPLKMALGLLSLAAIALLSLHLVFYLGRLLFGSQPD